jgi:hypothetical protein
LKTLYQTLFKAAQQLGSIQIGDRQSFSEPVVEATLPSSPGQVSQNQPEQAQEISGDLRRSQENRIRLESN